MATLSEYIDQKYGGRVGVIEQVMTVDTTPVRLLRNNPNRVGWVMINESTNYVRLAPTPQVSATTGWLLSSGGGVVAMHIEDDADAVFYEVWAAASGTGSNVRVREYVRL